ncbi:uncharacterized protein LOC128206883 [Mya arenaria]|uniref:uncharacterized protein LOC128206883 n=1 Tax=Mya arenaria TaxID=6604 RepID=UPI0022E1873C|nr:uncharacterized protein LOC128206883 [Mya arenaria]
MFERMHTAMAHRLMIMTVMFLLQVISLSTGKYMLNEDGIPDTILSSDDADPFTDFTDSEFGFTNGNTKGPSFQYDKDIQALVDIIYKQEMIKLQNQRKKEDFHPDHIDAKRAWRFPQYDFGRIFSSSFLRKPVVSKAPTFSRRRTQQLSVSGPLSALANMLAAEGRRRVQAQSFHNRMRLLDLGKRSKETVDSPVQDQDVMDRDDFEFFTQ